jgi:hypothetical protein
MCAAASPRLFHFAVITSRSTKPPLLLLIRLLNLPPDSIRV